MNKPEYPSADMIPCKDGNVKSAEYKMWFMGCLDQRNYHPGVEGRIVVQFQKQFSESLVFQQYMDQGKRKFIRVLILNANVGNMQKEHDAKFMQLKYCEIVSWLNGFLASEHLSDASKIEDKFNIWGFPREAESRQGYGR